MRRPLLFSCALHGVIVLVMLATTPHPPARESVGAAEIALDAAPPPIPAAAIDIDVVAHAGGGGPAHPEKPAAVEPARAHRRSLPATRTTAAVHRPAPRRRPSSRHRPPPTRASSRWLQPDASPRNARGTW